MATPTQKTKVGLFLLVCLFIFVGTVVAIAGSRGDRTVTYFMKFDTGVTGLGAGADVEFMGVKIGYVENIKVTDELKIEVEIKVRPDVATLREGVVASLSSNILSGIAFVQLKGGRGGRKLAAGKTIPTERAFIDTLQDTIEKKIKDVDVLVAKINLILDSVISEPEKSEIGMTIRNAKNLLAHIDELVVAVKTGDREQEIGRMIADFDLLLKKVDSMMTSVQRNTLSTKREAEMTMREMRATLAAVKRLVEMLEKDPSSLLRGKSKRDANNP